MVAPDKQESEGGENEDEVKLDWKDYVAFVIALFQTALLPIIIIIVVLLLIVLFIWTGRTIHLAVFL